MRILFLDDDRNRHSLFTNKLDNIGAKDISLHHAFDYNSFVELVSKNNYDMVFLDHDLSYEAVMCDPNNIEEKTGTDVAKWICENKKPNELNEIVIHSLNPVGSKNMVSILFEYGFSVVCCTFYTVIRHLSLTGKASVYGADD